MSTIIIGVDAGSYTFDASERQITISDIAGLSLASFKMIQNLTTGKPLYIFNGSTATFAGGVLTLPASADMSGAQDTDLLAIYVQESGLINPPSDGMNAFRLDIPKWTRTAQVTSFIEGAVPGPFVGSRGHTVVSNQSVNNNGLSTLIYCKDVKSGGVPFQFSAWLKSNDTSFSYQLNMFVNYTSGSRDVFTRTAPLTADWRRAELEGYAYRNDAFSIDVYLRTATSASKSMDVFGADLRIGSLGPHGYSPPSGSEYVTMRKDGAISVAAWGDSLTQQDWMIHCKPLFSAFHYYNGGVGGESSTQIMTRMVAAADQNKYGVVALWAGRNSIADPALVLSDTALMVAAMPHGRFLVLSVLNATDEPTGSAEHTNVTTINTALSAAYGTKYIDIKSLYNAGTTTDIPRSEYVTDDIHPTVVAKGIIADAVAKAIRANGWA